MLIALRLSAGRMNLVSQTMEQNFSGMRGYSLTGLLQQQQHFTTV